MQIYTFLLNTNVPAGFYLMIHGHRVKGFVHNLDILIFADDQINPFTAD